MKKAMISLGLLTIFGCSLSVKTLNLSKDKSQMSTSSDLSRFANAYFWDNFHQGNYSKIDSIQFYLAAAYSENPNHLETINHLGFTHIWALSESQKLDSIPPTIIDHATLALKYFGESYQLDTSDPRILGFLADSKLTVGTISEDKKLIRDGYFNGKKSIKQWKEFNYFTIGYVLSQLHQDTWQYEKALEWQWKTLEECYCKDFDRNNPDFKEYLNQEESSRQDTKKRTCWNNWIAPHNLEGYFLNMGDMLVKSGDWQKAQQIYSLAKQVPQYASWPFQDVLETRITSAEENVEKFRAEYDNSMKHDVNEVMLINSSISCMSCHQMNKDEFSPYGVITSE